MLNPPNKLICSPDLCSGWLSPKREILQFASESRIETPPPLDPFRVSALSTSPESNYDPVDWQTLSTLKLSRQTQRSPFVRNTPSTMYLCKCRETIPASLSSDSLSTASTDHYRVIIAARETHFQLFLALIKTSFTRYSDLFSARNPLFLIGANLSPP